MRKLIAVAALFLISCQQTPTRSGDLTEVLRGLQGQKVRLYLGGTYEASLAGTLTQMDPPGRLVTLESEHTNRMFSNPHEPERVTRVRKVIRIDCILAVATEESDR